MILYTGWFQRAFLSLVQHKTAAGWTSIGIGLNGSTSFSSSFSFIMCEAFSECRDFVADIRGCFQLTGNERLNQSSDQRQCGKLSTIKQNIEGVSGFVFGCYGYQRIPRASVINQLRNFNHKTFACVGNSLNLMQWTLLPRNFVLQVCDNLVIALNVFEFL